MIMQIENQYWINLTEITLEVVADDIWCLV